MSTTSSRRLVEDVQDEPKLVLSRPGVSMAVLRLRVAGLILIAAVGFLLGLLLPRRVSGGGGGGGGSNSSSEGGGAVEEDISAVLGWTYFAAWSLSFYPQLVLNWYRRSVVGLSFDFVLLNAVGFGCYSAFNLALRYSPAVKTAYEADNGGASSAVKLNDVVFALHALTLSTLNLVQIAIYERGAQRFSPLCKVAVVAIFAFAAVGAVLVAAEAIHGWTWLQYLYALSTVKLGVTLTKYVPQVVLNVRRRSTEGWNIDNVCLDFLGGTLSLAQLLLDAGTSGDWSKVSGDPVKAGLGFASMFFDVIFLVQHFVLYKKRPRALSVQADEPS